MKYSHSRRYEKVYRDLERFHLFLYEGSVLQLVSVNKHKVINTFSAIFLTLLNNIVFNNIVIKQLAKLGDPLLDKCGLNCHTRMVWFPW